MEIIEVVVATVIAGFIVWFGIASSLMASEEKRVRRKNFDAGTHDYYGNKLGEDDDK
jgi:hypothetical protein|tara:strand:- start:724 stop:894 length:171 start_codon:yes stop_codon:yes gene_type:complete